MAQRVCTLVLSSLPFVDTPFNTLYSHAGRFRSKQIYEQEMKLGHILLDLDKLLLFGTAGSGKTCSLAALLGVDPPTIRCSTPLMKRPIEVVFIDVNGKKRWKIRTIGELKDKIAEVIRSRIPRQQTVSQSSGGPASSDQQSPHTTLQNKHESVFLYTLRIHSSYSFSIFL